MSIKVFFCYARKDEPILDELKSHLTPLRRQGLISIWYDREINAGAEWKKEIEQQLNIADVILLMISFDFMNSEYCYGIEMRRAIERHEQGNALVIPIILRPVYWQVDPLDKLQALPTDAKPIMSSKWYSSDEALFDVVSGIRIAILSFIAAQREQPHNKPQPIEILSPSDATISKITVDIRKKATNNGTTSSTSPLLLTMSITKDKLAEAKEIDGEFIVLKGSYARSRVKSSLEHSRVIRREELYQEGKLIDTEDADFWLFAEDVSFASPSTAASVIMGTQLNGRIMWKVRDSGQTYKSWYEGQMKILSNAEHS